jgi:hypothetical protein
VGIRELGSGMELGRELNLGVAGAACHQSPHYVCEQSSKWAVE